MAGDADPILRLLRRLIVRGRVILKPLGRPASRGQRAVSGLRGSLAHLKRRSDELMALTRGED